MLPPEPIVMDFPCPWCGAEPGGTCRRKRLADYDRPPHAPRIDRCVKAFNLLRLDRMNAEDNAYNAEHGYPHRNRTDNCVQYLNRVKARIRTRCEAA